MALRATGQAKKKAQEDWRQRDREVRNIAQVNVRVPTGLKDHFKRFGELLRDGKKSWEAFDRVSQRLRGPSPHCEATQARAAP